MNDDGDIYVLSLSPASHPCVVQRCSLNELILLQHHHLVVKLQHSLKNSEVQRRCAGFRQRQNSSWEQLLGFKALLKLYRFTSSHSSSQYYSVGSDDQFTAVATIKCESVVVCSGLVKDNNNNMFIFRIKQTTKLQVSLRNQTLLLCHLLFYSPHFIISRLHTYKH